jgi:hypothetical protein
VTTQLPWPEDRPELLPFLPFVIDAWSDGVLSHAERDILRETLDGLAWLAGDGRAILAAWLDPEAPPSPSDLSALGALARTLGVADVDDATRSLTDLGLALWEASGAPGPTRRPDTRSRPSRSPWAAWGRSPPGRSSITPHRCRHRRPSSRPPSMGSV